MSRKKVYHSKLEINRLTLLRFAFNRWLAENSNKSLAVELKSGILSDIEFCRSLHGIGTISHYLFGQQSLTDDVIHRIIQLLSRYCHNVLRIPDRIDLRAHLLHTERGEPVLHVLKPFYRDHFFHVLEVCFLGHVLLETKLVDGQYLWKHVALKLKRRYTKNQILRLWYTAALLHDTGYAMDVLNNSLKFFGFFKHSTYLSDLDKKIKKTITKLSDEHKKEIEELGINYRDGLEQDHGIVGALHIFSLIKRIEKDTPELDSTIYLPAVRAIALHNLRNHNDKISFNKDPIAFLLAVCDQIQEWRRPRLSYAISPDWFLAKLGRSNTISSNLEGAFKSIKTNVEILPGEINLKFSKGLSNQSFLEFEIEYDQNVNRNSTVFNNWLDSTLNFQRLDFGDLPMDISVTYITPFFNNHNQNIKQSQLHRLRDAAHETHMSFLAEWFPNESIANDKGKCLTNGAITYIECDEEKQDKLILDLRKLSKRVFINRGMDAFWKCIKNWKHYNDDRDFPGDYVSTIPE